MDPSQLKKPRRAIMTTANAKYSFDITSSEALDVHPKSGLAKVIVSGVCTNADGVSFAFVATNNLDQRYPERFKVNWNGSKARMPEVVGFGIADETRGSRSVSEGLYFTRGARIAIARKCLAIWPEAKQRSAGSQIQSSSVMTDASAFTYNESLNR